MFRGVVGDSCLFLLWYVGVLEGWTAFVSSGRDEIETWLDSVVYVRAWAYIVGAEKLGEMNCNSVDWSRSAFNRDDKTSSVRPILQGLRDGVPVSPTSHLRAHRPPTPQRVTKHSPVAHHPHVLIKNIKPKSPPPHRPCKLVKNQDRGRELVPGHGRPWPEIQPRLPFPGVGFCDPPGAFRYGLGYDPLVGAV